MKKSDSLSKLNKIADFEWLIEKIWCISNADYQNRIWVSHDDLNIIDSYNDTTMYFLEDAETVLNAQNTNRVLMKENQYNMLKKLYEMVETYDLSKERPDRDENIVKDPKWNKIRGYAEKVHKELKNSSF